MTRPDPNQTELDESWYRPLQAMWWLKKGDFKTGPEWEKAHEICQEAEGTADYDHVHALVHWIEGDDWNSGYWLRSAGRDRVGTTVSAEWDAVVDRLLQESMR